MTNSTELRLHLELGLDVISDASIDQMERAGGVTFNYTAREILQDLARDYVLRWLDRPPPKREVQKMATLHKPMLKRQKERNRKIARIYKQGADLLQEELKDPLSKTGLVYRLLMNDPESGTSLEDAIILPRLEAQRAVP